VHLGLFIFIFFHAFVLSSRYARAFTTIDVQFAELEKTNLKYKNEVAERQLAEAAVRKLNEELEQRVLERTAKLHESEEKYRLLVENTQFPITVVDRDGRFVFVNQIGAGNLDSTPEAVIGKSIFDVFSQPQAMEFLARIQNIIESSSGGFFEDAIMLSSGERWFWSNMQPIKNEHGNPIAVQVISQDITERKQAEAELVKAKQATEQSIRTKERFLARISHEIRTPLNTVVGMSHLLQKSNPNPEQLEYLQTLQTASGHLLGIITDILDFSKIEAGAVEFKQVEFKLPEILESVKQAFRHQTQEKKIELITSYNHRIPPKLIGDPMRLNQILFNLIANAIKFTDKGFVIVNVELIKEDDRSVTLSFSVIDTGIGIPADKLEVIFESFAQADYETMRKYGGTGLGLTIVKQLVEMQGGSISVESQIDKGSTFRFTLPFEKATANSAQSVQTTPINETVKRLDGLRVLLVEDDPLSQRVAMVMLKKWGATVEVADNGQVAIQKLTTRAYDVILIDVLMPGMDGYETTHYIRHEMSGAVNRIPIIALTASTSIKAHEKVLACGMDDYITKPFEPEELCTKIIKLTSRQHQHKRCASPEEISSTGNGQLE
jgi:hypothetical protein